MRRVGEDIEHAATVLAAGGVVAFPTETVYGLGASARRPQGVRRVFEIKQRPLDRPLIVHVDGPEAIDAWATHAPDWARTLARQLWPGPLTLVLARASTVPVEVSGGGATVALRAPDHPSAMRLLEALARLEGGRAGIAAPSANLHGAIPPTTAQAVADGLGSRVDYVLDGGRCSVGIESTVVDATGSRPVVVREGAVPRERLAALTGMAVATGSAVDAVAVLSTHARIVPFDDPARIAPGAGDGVVSRGPWTGSPLDAARCLELTADPDAYGHALYEAVRALEGRGCERLYVQRAPDVGIGRAINARLERAARRG